MLSQIKAYYKKLVPGLSDDDWNLLSPHLSFQSLKKGEFLVRNGDTCRNVSFINSGLLRLFYLRDGKEISTGFMVENEYISSYGSFLTQTPSAENIDASEDCELINLSYDSIQEIYQSSPVFERFGRKIAEQLFIMVSSQTTRLLTLGPEERYQSVIQYQPWIIQRVPQYMIASLIGITPEHLSRLRKKMTGKQPGSLINVKK